MSAAKEQGETAPNRRARSRREPSDPVASVNMDELRELIALMRENGLAELELEREDFRVRLRRDATRCRIGCSTRRLQFLLPLLFRLLLLHRQLRHIPAHRRRRGFPGSGSTHYPVANRRHVLPVAVSNRGSVCEDRQ